VGPLVRQLPAPDSVRDLISKLYQSGAGDVARAQDIEAGRSAA